MYLIIGLGNPGKKYSATRHNVGFSVLDALARKLHLEFQEKKTLPAEVAADENVTLLKPQTFMNLSGEAVSAFLNKNHLPEKNILVIFDDADLPFGEIRYRDSGSAGGHHGLEDILNKTKKDPPRLRIGIGRPSDAGVPLDEWVLSKWSQEEKKAWPELLEKIVKLILEKINLS